MFIYLLMVLANLVSQDCSANLVRFGKTRSVGFFCIAVTFVIVECRRNENLIKELSVPRAGSHDLEFPTQYSRSPWTQFQANLWKQNKTYWRSPYYNAVRFFFTVICALIFGSVFWNLGSRR